MNMNTNRIGSFCIIRNEAPWIAGHLLAWLPILDQMVFLDGNSTDGTLEIIEAIKRDSQYGGKIKLIRDKDPKDLQDDYVRVSNEALHSVDCDLAFFLHPDMHPSKVPANFSHLDGAIAASVQVRSFAGEPDGQLYEIEGRSSEWKSIARLRNPALGAHYHGHYGVHNEDVYFSSITGDEHVHYGRHMDLYPYEVIPSGLEVLHFSDVRPYERRLSRMRACLKNQRNNVTLAENHPRVTLKPGGFKCDTFNLVPAEYPAEMVAARNKYRHMEKTHCLVS